MAQSKRLSFTRFSWFWLLGVLLCAMAVAAMFFWIVVPQHIVHIPVVWWLVLLLMIGGLGTLGILIYMRRLQRRMLIPLTALTKVTEALAAGTITNDIVVDRAAFQDVQNVSDAIVHLAGKANRDLEEMKKLERVRSEFIANVSHELRTPIFSVQGYLETLLDGAVDDPTVSKQFLQKAYNNALRLNTLLSDLIDISRIESGELRLSFRYVNIVDILRDVVHTLEFRAEQRGVQVRIDVVKSELLVYGDKERLQQVCTNLIDNAIKYNVPNGSVTVQASPSPYGVEIAVVDTGIGIPAESVGRIFERFYRVDKDRSRAVGGTGLGLAIVKHILEAHHTTIAVESAVGVGTKISFSLRST
jgi:two-component system, OmpR family, phosphate regulon sensor histidine kinase PhoR